MSDIDAMECASYLSTLTFNAVGQLFTQAQEIKNWLNRSAYQIAETGKPVKWSTPLGKLSHSKYTIAHGTLSHVIAHFSGIL